MSSLLSTPFARRMLGALILLGIAFGVSLALATTLVPGGMTTLAPPVLAQSCGVASPCLNESTKGVSALTVRHDWVTPSINGKVRVNNTAETWDVTPHWQTANNAANCQCDDVSPTTVTVDVDFNPALSQWQVNNCNGCDPVNGPVYRVAVCDVGNCSAATKPYAYRLIVEMDRERTVTCVGGSDTGYLNRVQYDSVALSAGLGYSGLDCTVTTTVVNPIYSSYSTNDPGDWECDFNCSTARGPELSITYQ